MTLHLYFNDYPFAFRNPGLTRNRIGSWCLWIPLCLFSVFCRAQTEDPQAAEQLENLFRDSEQAPQSDAPLLIEILENLRNKPLDLNKCSQEDLAETHLLNDLQLANFMIYRSELGPFLNEYELQAVPDWDVETIRRILQYAIVPTGIDTRNTNLTQGFTEGQNDLLLRWGRPDPPVYGDQAVEGKPNNWALRYRHQFDNRLRFGFTAENDPGEAFFKGSNRKGFDFYSVHLFGQNLGKRLRTIALGDYSVRFGQGLLLQTGFSPGKSAETTQVTRNGRKINAYAAFGESFFFRGAATTFALSKNIDLTVLYSNRLRDGNIRSDTTDQEFPEIAFTALQSSGLHRSEAEVADEQSLREQAAAFSATYSWKEGNVSLNGLALQYNKPWQPDAAAYRRYVFRGQNLTGFSADYHWRHRNWLLFGETARSDNGALASLNGLLFSPDRHVTLTTVHRYLPPDYQSVYAAPFAEVSGASNENGLYMGADVRFIRRWQLNFYTDVWQHPWLRFGVSGPSQGREYLARVNWMRSKIFSAYLLWQTESKERDSDLPGESGLLENRRDRVRLHAIYKVSPAVELRSRLEWVTFRIDRAPRSHGFIAYQEVVWKPLGFPLTSTFRYAVYDTDDFDTRVFAYETDLFSAVSIPAFSGRGARYYLNLKWRVNKWLRLESRFEQTIQRKAVTDSGAIGRETFWKLQARLKW